MDKLRYSPSKVRARVEEKLGWKAGSSKDLSFPALRELVKGKFPKLVADISGMLEAGDHLVEEEPEGVAVERARRFDAWERAARAGR